MVYKKPDIRIVGVTEIVLVASGPCATSIGSPNVDDNYSVWDEVKQLNHKEEQNYEENWN